LLVWTGAKYGQSIPGYQLRQSESGLHMSG
jgi:hypothetical protein